MYDLFLFLCLFLVIMAIPANMNISWIPFWKAERIVWENFGKLLVLCVLELPMNLEATARWEERGGRVENRGGKSMYFSLMRKIWSFSYVPTVLSSSSPFHLPSFKLCLLPTPYVESRDRLAAWHVLNIHLSKSHTFRNTYRKNILRFIKLFVALQPKGCVYMARRKTEKRKCPCCIEGSKLQVFIQETEAVPKSYSSCF